MKVINALDAKKGEKTERRPSNSLTQPIQFLSKKDKDHEWAAWNLDWLEWQGIKQLQRNSRRLLKNYKLAKGIIDKSDYILEENPQQADLIASLTEEDVSALELKFYPIIPNVVNTLHSEFSKRNTKLTFKAVDQHSYKESFDAKRQMLEERLFNDAYLKVQQKLIDLGAPLDDENAQQQLSEENLKTLPEIQQFMDKGYISVPEQWAQHQHDADMERFNIDELEERGFYDLLVADREFWHFKMMEDDYDMELWNPVTTFYHKSPDARYISEGNWVGKVDMMSIADVIDKYGWVMNQKQLETLEQQYPIKNVSYNIGGMQNDGSFYDGTKSHDWNTTGPSLAMRQFTSFHDTYTGEGDIVQWILGESEDMFDYGENNLLRVTTTYWKSQRKVGYLLKINEQGETSHLIVDEDYKVTDKPIYDQTFLKNKTKRNLIFGEHIEWIWINEVWGGVKIGPSHFSLYGQSDSTGIDPMYIGINQNKIGRLKFQFKGDKNLYGCKLPVEGAVFGDRNTESVSLVDLMKPYQIGYNIVNNQIADILVDELGTVIMFDQNALPRHSMGEDWGKANLENAYIAMKNFQMMPLDTTISNTENALNFQHTQVLNLEQTNRLMSRVNLANYFKNQAFENIGVTPQRMGQQIEQETAEGVRASLNGSHAQTEMYFNQHCDHLMPRVHKMRTDLAQYYHSTNPSIRLQHLTPKDEKIFFEMDGTDLLLRELNIFANTKANHRETIEQLRNLALTNNTAGASIYDLSNIIQAESLSEITDAMKASERKMNEQRAQEQQHAQQMQEQQLQAEAAEKQATRDYDSQEAEKERRKDVLVAEIRAAGYGNLADTDQDQQSDFTENLKIIKQSEEYDETMSFEREKEGNKTGQYQQKMNLEREKLITKKQIADKQLEIAKTNKNRHDSPSKAKKK